MKNLTHNDLTELQDLLAIINSDIEKFMHVSDFLPKKLVQELEKFTDKISDELEKRENS